MKKIIALFMSAILIVSALSATCFIANSEQPIIDFTSIDFDNQETFYKNNKQNSNLTYIVDSSTGGKFLRYTYLSGYDVAKPLAFKLCNSDGKNAFRVEQGKKYTFNFEYFNKRLTHNAYIALLILDSGSEVSALPTIKSVKENTPDKFISISTISFYDPKEWKKKSAEFTANATGEVAMVAYFDQKYTGNALDIDNISVDAVIDSDGTTYDVAYYYNKGSDPAGGTVVKMKKGYSYGYPSYEGYIFRGWYMDSAFTMKAPASVRESCTKVYAKWEKDNRVPQTAFNTYDDEGITYGDLGNGMYSFKSVASPNEEISRSAKPVVIKDEQGKDNTVLQIQEAGSYTWQWPTMVRVYDDKTKNARFDLHSTSAYEISLKYKVNKEPSKSVIIQAEQVAYGIGNPNGKYDTKSILIDNLATVKELTDGWVTAKGIFYTGEISESVPMALTYTVVSSDGYSCKDFDIYIDDVSVKECLNVEKIIFHTNGGTTLADACCISGNPLPKIDVPTKNGKYFEGWYTDPDFIMPLSSSVMPEGTLELYARWSDNVTPPAKSVTVDFETDGLSDNYYHNNGINENISNDLSTSSITWYPDNELEAFEGKGCLKLDNPENLTKNSGAWNTVAVLNPDGTKYKIAAGNRYHILYSYRVEGSQNGGHSIDLVTSEQMPVLGINGFNSSTVDSFTYSSEAINDTAYSEWGIHETYVEPDVSGNLYIAFYSSRAMQWAFLDSLSITKVTNDTAVVVNYYNENGSKLITSRIGAVGSRLVDADNQLKNGYIFDGWRLESGELFTSNTFPQEDTNVYASFKEDTGTYDNVSIDWSSDRHISFEDTNGVKPFYGDAQNSYSPGTGVYIVVNDKENAHDGNNYFKFNKVGHWMDQYFRRFKLYTEGTPRNYVWMDPDSAYRITYYIRVDDCSGGTNLFTVLFDEYNDTKNYTVAAENYMTLDSELETAGQWKKIEQTITTGENTSILGFAMYGGYLTACIDDITVTKLKNISVSFETNGGNEIGNIEQLSQNLVVEPIEPTREGYTFAGWYSDKGLTKKFDFKETIVNNDLKLYAKWTKVVVPQPKYKDVTHTEYTEETVTVPGSNVFGTEKIAVQDNDRILKIPKLSSVKNNEKDSKSNLPVWPFILAAVILIASVITGILIVKKRKKRTGEGV